MKAACSLAFRGVQLKPENVLANRWFQPLTHVSSGCSPRVCGVSCQRGKREKRGATRLATSQCAAQFVPSLFAGEIVQ